MKQASFPLMVILLFSWVACNNSRTESSIAASVANTTEAPMVLPDAKDTLLTSGRRNIYLIGRRNMAGFFVERSLFPAGYKGMPHIHNNDLYVTVIEGTANMGIGKVFDTTASFRAYGPGSFLVIPADQPHYEWFPAACTLQIEGIGPQETFYTSDTTKTR